jgi:hypothetical protein
MRSKMETHSDEAEKRVRDIRRATRRSKLRVSISIGQGYCPTVRTWPYFAPGDTNAFVRP